ncbi:MAG: hypothetical protein J1F29_01510, partial [Lentimicrobiaceae bacterium]|nr:hypothetical protein [Lentimicrobiaceae bacterium]
MKKIFYWGILALMALLGLSSISQAQTVTFTPSPDNGAVDPGQTIEISCDNESYTIYYGMFASKDEAQSAEYFNGAGDEDDDAFWSAWSNKILDPGVKEPTIQQGATVIRVGLYDTEEEKWFSTDYYAEYTIKGAPTVTFTPSPNNGAVDPGQTIEISCDNE